MPDDALFTAAQAGELTRPDGLQKQLERMLADNRVQSMVRSFHHQLMDLDRYSDLSRSTQMFPEFAKDLPTSMVGEAEAFIQYVVFDQKGGVETLLTAPYTFVDARLAQVYKINGTFDSSFQRAQLDGKQRAGLLTQVGFLTVNANQTDSDPIHRGVFINRRILCATLPAPPNNVPPLQREPAARRATASSSTPSGSRSSTSMPWGVGGIRTTDCPSTRRPSTSSTTGRRPTTAPSISRTSSPPNR